MLETLTKENWEAYLNETFKIDLDGQGELDVQLTKITGNGRRRNGHREGYALEFAGPLEPRLIQRIYKIGHERMGQLEIFLVPVASMDGKIYYEAVFT